MIQTQRLDQNGIYMKLGDGRELTITAAEVRSIFQQQNGSIAARRTATINAVKQLISDGFGSDIPAANITFLFDDATGRPLALEVKNTP